MTSRSMSEGRHERHSGRGRRMLWLQAVGLLLSALLAVSWPVARAAEAEAEPVLEAVDISPLSGNRLQLRFRLSGRLAAPPSAFTINEPARIVLDFLGTRNGLSTRQQAINV
ncbi:MAG: AMIN domain-containing protein, partial [Candidatus Competibacteraceae bacterium]